MRISANSMMVLVWIIAILAAAGSLLGLLSGGGTGEYEYQSIHGEVVTISGSGLYKLESSEQKLGLIVQDSVTLILAVPLLLVAYYFAKQGSLRGRLLLAGTLGYFVYTYVTYTFLRIYNPLFLGYVLLMAASLAAFVLCLMSFNQDDIRSCAHPRVPVKLIGSYQLLLAISLISLWIPPILDSLLNGTLPTSLDHYNSLGYEAFDLGIIVPTLIVSAILLIKRKPAGYFMSSIIIMLSISMNILISVLTLFQLMNGMEMPLVVAVMFPFFTLLTGLCLRSLMKYMDVPVPPGRSSSAAVNI